MVDIIIWNPSAKADPVAYMPDFLSGFYPVRTCGAHQIASWLRQHHYTVKVIDFCDIMSTDQLIDITRKYLEISTVAIGISTTFLEFEKSYLYNYDGNKTAVPEWIKHARAKITQIHSQLTWMVGGANHWIFDPAEWKIFPGNTEDKLLEFFNELSNKKSANLFDIKTLHKSFDLTDHLTSHDVLPIELGRGCMFKCKFCSWEHIGKKPGTYLRHYESIRAEILEHHYAYGTTRFTYVDDTVNESIDKLNMLVKIKNSVPFNLEWIGYIRADLIWAYPETVELLRESGLRSAFFGIESFNKDVSKLIGKGWSGKHAKDYLLKLKSLWGKDITFELGLIVGLPGQTVSELKDDIKWLIDNEIYSWWISSLVVGANVDGLSEFNRNSAQYGFTFPNSKNNMYWENGYWNSKKAFDVYVELRELSKGHTTIASFGLSNFASIGYKFDDLMHVKYKDLPTAKIYQKREDYLTNYITKSLQ